MEERISTNIFLLGSIRHPQRLPVRAAGDPLNYVTRVKQPTLMLNGEYDVNLPFEMTVKPMYELLGTPEEDKNIELYDTDHFVPRNELIRETLKWLDRYLGPVRNQVQVSKK